MANDQHPPFSRRGFVQSGLLAGGAFLARPAAARAADAEPATLPRRVLGRTNASLPVLTLGTAPSGFAKPQAPENVVRCVHTAIELGVNAIDTAPAYDVAEQGVGMALGTRRKEVFLSTKVLADEIAKAEKILANSLRVLKTDYLDWSISTVSATATSRSRWARRRASPGCSSRSRRARSASSASPATTARKVSPASRVRPGRRPAHRRQLRRSPHVQLRGESPARRAKHKVGIVAMKVFGGRTREATIRTLKAPANSTPSTSIWPFATRCPCPASRPSISAPTTPSKSARMSSWPALLAPSPLRNNSALPSWDANWPPSGAPISAPSPACLSTQAATASATARISFLDTA